MDKVLKVGITGVGSLLGQGILRSIKESNLRVTTVGFCVDKYSTGLYWCDESHFIPFAKDENFVDVLISKIKRSKIDVLLVGTDVELDKISKNKKIIESETGAVVLISDPYVVELGDDKYKTAKFFAERNVPATESVLPADENSITELVNKHGFPLIVKPRKGMRSYGVVKVDNIKDLHAAINNTTDPVVQECLSELEGEYTASGIYFDGECKATIVMRRELRDGNTYRAFTIKNEKLNDTVRLWTEMVKPFGPINFQFRIDKNGNPKVFEINSRFSGTTPLRAKAGFNEVEMCLKYLMYKEPIVQPEIKELMILRYWDAIAVELDSSELGGHLI
jgi:carbamoyl-phosphate synthase large subunit